MAREEISVMIRDARWLFLGLTLSLASAPQAVAPGLPAELLDWPASVVRPRLSPDGSRVAFSSALDGAMDLFVADTRSGVVRRLTDTAWDDARPDWSPDGKELVFQSNRDGSRDLWILAVDSGATRRLTRSEHVESLPDWSGRGDWITYISDASGSWDVWIVRPDGTQPTRLTVHEGNEYHPRFSPNGTQIVFYPTWSGWTDIYTVDVADGRVREVLGSQFEDYHPAWSADGSHIVFSSDRSTPPGLWLVPATGGEPQPFLREGHNVDYPDWSADGAAVLYLEKTRYSHLFTTVLGAGSAQRITSDDRAAADSNPDVSPDGSVLAYETSRYGNEGNVAVRSLSTTEERRVTAGRINDGMPRFSPSGGRLVFTQSGGDQASGVAVVRDLETGIETRWTDKGNVMHATFCGEDTIVFSWTTVAYTVPLELWRQGHKQPAARVGTLAIEPGGLDCDAGGNWIVASAYDPGADSASVPRLVRVDLESGDVQVLTRGVTPHLHPRVSPDGTRIVFVANSGDGFAAYVVPVSGGSPQRVLGPEHDVGSADWSGPESLIYSTVTQRDAARLHRVQTQTSSAVQDAYSNQQPAWSPDGAQRVFGSQRDALDEIYSMIEMNQRRAG